MKVVLFVAALVSVATTAGMVFSLLEPTLRFFGEISPVPFITGTNWAPLFEPPSYGVLAPVAATFTTTAVAVVVAVPLGLAAAIYLSEYAKPRIRKIFKPILEILAGIPTVVFGFFALSFVTPILRTFLEVSFRNMLSAGLVMGIMIIPLVASLSEDAMASVPNSLREGAYALGSSKMLVSLRVVVPAALSGIVAAIILAISRAVGETMIVAMAAGAMSQFTFNPTLENATMAAFIAQAGSGDLVVDSIDYNTIFAVGSLLFLITFVMNLVSTRLVRRFREVYE